MVMRIVVVLALAASVAAADTNDELVKQGFNVTYGVTAEKTPVKVELLVAPSDDPFEIALVFDGDAAVRLVGPHEVVIAQWQGTHADLRLTRVLPPGRYRVDVTPGAGAKVRGVVGMKGPVIGQCTIDPARLSEHAAGKGFRWPYLLVRPKTATATTLLVLPNNTGFATDDLDLIRASATCALQSELALADRLGTPVLVPLFPRPPETGGNLYLHALTRDALAATSPALARVDLQLIAMIDDARAALAAQHLEPRVLIAGFSAAGSFANRFAVLHPDRTRAAAVGSPGGWPLAPVESDGRDRLPYPVGIADIKALTGAAIDRAALAKVAFFFFLGGDDANDAVVHRDSFSADDEALVMRRFGKTPVARWAAAQRLYEQAKLHATFKLYPGVAHEITPAMLTDVEAAFRAALARQ
jgi:dienelactone hydrolase